MPLMSSNSSLPSTCSFWGQREHSYTHSCVVVVPPLMRTVQGCLLVTDHVPPHAQLPVARALCTSLGTRASPASKAATKRSMVGVRRTGTVQECTHLSCTYSSQDWYAHTEQQSCCMLDRVSAGYSGDALSEMSPLVCTFQGPDKLNTGSDWHFISATNCLHTHAHMSETQRR